MSQTTYCLDTSAFLYLADTYSSDVFPEVWEQLGELVANEALIAPREVHRELQRADDNGAWTWALEHRALFRPLDAEQADVATQIVNSAELRGLFDLDSEVADADPFVAALAVICQYGGDLFSTATTSAVVAVGSPAKRVGLKEVCQVSDYNIRFLTPYQMLVEIGLDVPQPDRRGLADLYGAWSHLEITEEEIEGVRIRLGGVET